jgi:hypothetical protein
MKMVCLKNELQNFDTQTLTPYANRNNKSINSCVFQIRISHRVLRQPISGRYNPPRNIFYVKFRRLGRDKAYLKSTHGYKKKSPLHDDRAMGFYLLK